MSRYGRSAFETLKKHSLSPKKRFGQNFLVHRQTAEAIVRAGNVCSEDTIVEVGVGLGALTVPLAAAAGRVIGFEIDSGLVRFHQTERDLPGNVTLIHQDILKADFNEIASKYKGKLKLLANLPYSISNPFIFKLIENSTLIDNVTVMLQKEVADRLSADVGTKDYGVPTILLATCATVTKKLSLKPNEFHPKPKVNSEVIFIDFNTSAVSVSEIEPYSAKLLRTIVRSTFNQRRKTLLNTLGGSNVFGFSPKNDKSKAKALALDALKQANIEPGARPETLSPKRFIELAISVEKIIKEIREES